jgi:outer membrane lipopolysaccharide assembly protein LptE/RlpB
MANKRLLSLAAFLLLFSMACGFGSQKLNAMSQTLTPLSAEVAGTVTAQAANLGGAADQLATAYADATATSASVYATETSIGVVNNESVQATATVSAPVIAELPRYGIKPSQGYVAWVHKPVTIDLNGYQQSGYANDYQGVVAKDFVMAADITWVTDYGMSACGFMFRSNGNTNKPSQYMVIITRFANGYLAFTATVDGEMSNMRTFYPQSQDKSFSWQNNDTNRLAVVMRGALIDVYTNGVLIGTIDTTQPPPDNQQSPPKIEKPTGANADQLKDYQNLIDQNSQNTDLMNSYMSDSKKNFAKNKPIFSEGLLGFIGVSESGHTKCTFSDGWLFIIER